MSLNKLYTYILFVSSLFLWVACNNKPEKVEANEVINKAPKEMMVTDNDEAKVVSDGIEKTESLDTEVMSSEKLSKKVEDATGEVEAVVEKQDRIVKHEQPKAQEEIENVIVEKVEEAKEVVKTTKTEIPVKDGKPRIVKPEPPKHQEKIENVLDEKPEEVKETKKNEEKAMGSKTDITKPATKPINHAAFHQLLKKYVTASGVVDYAGIKSNIGTLDTYLAELTSTNVSDLSRSAQLAFWINAYNAFTLKKITDNYPLKSMTDLDGGKPWDKKWIQLDGRTLSLNNIENDIIRPTFNEPRIHFAVNCAARSCPPLLNQGWSAGNLNTYLEQQTKAFINNSAHNQISADKIKVSKIFEWYAQDFGNLIDYLNKYSSVKINGDARIEYGEYDWSLNGKR